MTIHLDGFCVEACSHVNEGALITSVTKFVPYSPVVINARFLPAEIVAQPQRLLSGSLKAFHPLNMIQLSLQVSVYAS